MNQWMNENGNKESIYFRVILQDDHHGHVLGDGADELDDVGMAHLLQEGELVLEGVAAERE